MGPIYESLVLVNGAVEDVANMEKQIDWLLVRRIRLSSFQIIYPLPVHVGVFSKVAAVLKHSQTHLQTLNVEENEALFNAVAATVSQYCTGVSVLSVNDMKLGAPFFILLHNLNNLKELSIINCELDIEEARGFYCPSLSALSLQGDFSAQAQKAMLELCPGIVSFSMFAANEVDLNDLPSTLKTFHAGGCSISGNLKADLTKLMLWDCPTTDDTVTRCVANCSHLQELVVTSGALTDATMRLIGDKYGDCLQQLSLQKCGPVTSEGMSHLLTKCKVLILLCISLPRLLDPIYITTALENNPLLHTLDISDTFVTDEVLLSIAAAPLKTLLMVSVTGYTVKGLMGLMKGCFALKTLFMKEKLINPLVVLLWQDMHPQLQIKLFQ